MQMNRAFDVRRKTSGQQPFDEVAVKAAQQLRRGLPAEVQVCEVIHGACLLLRAFFVRLTPPNVRELMRNDVRTVATFPARVKRDCR